MYTWGQWKNRLAKGWVEVEAMYCQDERDKVKETKET
jgi:hypothetical protein